VNRRARRCLGVDIGSTSLKVAELSQDRSGVIIQRLVEAPLDVGPDTPAETRWATVVQTLRDLLREHKFGTHHAVFALPGHAVFVRRVRLPRTSEERLERIIRFEARQQIPFPLEQTILQYQIASTENRDEVEVLLVAIKRDIVENYMALIRKLPLRPVRLGVSSFALFNFYMFDQGIEPEEFSLEWPLTGKVETVPVEGAEPAKPAPEKPAKPAGLGATLKNLFGGKKKEPAANPKLAEEVAGHEAVATLSPPEEVKAFVNIGAATMDLAIGRTGESRILGFARSIPMAGHQLTRIIQERCGLESFAEAERVKREKTQVVLGNVTPPADRCNEEACRAIMPVVDRMVAEIRRSLDFYISQPDGMAVDRVVLSGGQSTLTNLAAYLEERLAIRVEIEREVHNPSCRMGDRAASDLTPFVISIGLALHGLGTTCINIDFLPEQLKGWIEFKRKNIQLAVQGALLAGMLFLVSQTGDRMSAYWQKEAREMNLAYVGVKPLMDRYTKAQTRRVLLEGVSLVVLRGSGMPVSYGLDRDYFFKVLSWIQSERPPDVFFSEISLGPNGDFSIKGLAEQERSAAELTQRLAALKEVESARLNGPPVLDPVSRGASGARVYQFMVRGKIKSKQSRIVPSPTPFGGPQWAPTRTPARPGVPGAPTPPGTRAPGTPAPGMES